MAQSAYKPAAVSNGGTIAGKVVFEGSVPKDLTFGVTKDDRVCGKSVPSQTLIVGKNRGVRNAVIYLEQISTGKVWDKTNTPVLDQQGCEYHPHVSIIPSGSTLEIVNSDPILHNVHLYSFTSVDQTICNIAQPVKGQRTNVEQIRTAPSRFLHATCDAGHPWMNAYIMRADNPYYVLTDADGEFSLTNVPPGTYKLTMWHEGVRVVKTLTENGRVSKYYFEDPYTDSEQVTVSPLGTARVDFQFTLRGSPESGDAAERTSSGDK